MLNRIGFIGAGKIAQALAKGFLLSGKITGANIIGSCDPNDKQSAKTWESFGAKITFNNREVIENADIIVLAIKPFIAEQILKEIRNENCNKLYLSIMMGIRLEMLEKYVRKAVRIMSNTASEIGSGTTVLVPGSRTDCNDLLRVHELLSLIGVCETIADEKLIDVCTALCGSGPAFVYIFLESLVNGAIKLGMPKDLALKLAIHTTIGASSMVSQKNIHPAVLKDDVTSPAGSTAMGLYALENNGFRSSLMKALESATDRCTEISKNK